MYFVVNLPPAKLGPELSVVCPQQVLPPEVVQPRQLVYLDPRPEGPQVDTVVLLLTHRQNIPDSATAKLTLVTADPSLE